MDIQLNPIYHKISTVIFENQVTVTQDFVPSTELLPTIHSLAKIVFVHGLGDVLVVEDLGVTKQVA